MTEVTRILQKMAEGDTHESAALMPLVYNELRRLAARELRNDPAGNTLQPTALVHEAYVRLVDQNNEPRWHHRGHFYAAAAEAMRRVLVESARRKQSLKRGGGRERVPLEEGRMAAPQRDAELLGAGRRPHSTRRPSTEGGQPRFFEVFCRADDGAGRRVTWRFAPNG